MSSSSTTTIPDGYELVLKPVTQSLDDGIVKFVRPFQTIDEANENWLQLAEKVKSEKDPKLLYQARVNLMKLMPALASSSVRGGQRTRNKKVKGSVTTNTEYAYDGPRPQLRRSIRLPQITVEMIVQQTAFTTSNVATVYYANYLTLSSFADYTSYTSLFDQYRIDEIEVWMQPFQSRYVTQAATGSWVTAIDLDDANTPTTIASVQAKAGAQETGGDSGHYHRWKPHVAVAEYSGAFASFGNAPAGWVDCASPGVQHYGIKSAITATTNATAYTFIAKALVSFRAPGI